MQKGEKFTMFIGIIIYLIISGIFVKMFQDGSGGSALKIWVPWGCTGIFISFYLYREFNRVNKAKKHNRREALNVRRQELLDNVLKKSKKTDPPEE
jgi:hypothetical protein